MKLQLTSQEHLVVSIDKMAVRVFILPMLAAICSSFSWIDIFSPNLLLTIHSGGNLLVSFVAGVAWSKLLQPLIVLGDWTFLSLCLV